MKKLVALLCVLTLLCAALPGMAAGDYPLDEKFVRQVLESAYQGTLTAEITGDGTAALPGATWRTLSALLPRISMETTHSYQRGEGEATLRLLVDGQSAGETRLMYNAEQAGVKSDLLGGEATYAFVRNWNAASLLQAFAQGDSAWPPLWRVLLAVESAPAEWKTRAAERLSSYETKMGIWMNSYASFRSGTEDNVAYTELYCAIPPQAVRAQIKQMLVDFYADSELLSLLREVLTAQEAAAYLQPGMQNAIFAMLDAVQLEGNVEVIRRYDAQGKPLLDSVSMPMAQTQALTGLTVSVATEDMGNRWRAVGATRTGVDFDVSCLVSEERIYAGTVSVTLPEEKNDSFVVTDSAVKRRTIALDYSLSVDEIKETYNLSTDKCELPLKATLLLRPGLGTNLPEQAVTLDVLLSSGSSQRSPTRLDGSLTWKDMESGASVALKLSSRTTSPKDVNSLATAGALLRIDLMDEESRAALARSWRSRAQQWLLDVAQQLLGASTTENSEGLG